MEIVQFFPICKVEELPEGERIFIAIGDAPVVIFNISGAYYAIDDRCTHDEGPLGEGDVEDSQIICPRHGARFDIRTGNVLSLPAVQGVSSYPIRVVEGTIEIGLEM